MNLKYPKEKLREKKKKKKKKIGYASCMHTYETDKSFFITRSPNWHWWPKTDDGRTEKNRWLVFKLKTIARVSGKKKKKKRASVATGKNTPWMSDHIDCDHESRTIFKPITVQKIIKIIDTVLFMLGVLFPWRELPTGRHFGLEI